MGFRGLRLGFGGWDKGTWGLGIGLGEGDLGFRGGAWGLPFWDHLGIGALGTTIWVLLASRTLGLGVLRDNHLGYWGAHEKYVSFL